MDQAAEPAGGVPERARDAVGGDLERAQDARARRLDAVQDAAVGLAEVDGDSASETSTRTPDDERAAAATALRRGEARTVERWTDDPSAATRAVTGSRGTERPSVGETAGRSRRARLSDAAVVVAATAAPRLAASGG